jgi:hypothetical protein
MVAMVTWTARWCLMTDPDDRTLTKDLGLGFKLVIRPMEQTMATGPPQWARRATLYDPQTGVVWEAYYDSWITAYRRACEWVNYWAHTNPNRAAFRSLGHPPPTPFMGGPKDG